MADTLASEIRSWIDSYPDSLTRVRLRNLADALDERDAEIEALNGRIDLAEAEIRATDLESGESLQADLAERVRNALGKRRDQVAGALRAKSARLNSADG